MDTNNFFFPILKENNTIMVFLLHAHQRALNTGPHAPKVNVLPLHYEASGLMQFTHDYILLQKSTPQVLYAES